MCAGWESPGRKDRIAVEGLDLTRRVSGGRSISKLGRGCAMLALSIPVLARARMLRLPRGRRMMGMMSLCTPGNAGLRGPWSLPLVLRCAPGLRGGPMRPPLHQLCLIHLWDSIGGFGFGMARRLVSQICILGHNGWSLAGTLEILLFGGGMMCRLTNWPLWSMTQLWELLKLCAVRIC